MAKTRFRLREEAFDDLLLNFDMNEAFDLQIALVIFFGVLLSHCPLNVDRVRVVPFDQDAVIAVDNAQQSLDAFERERRQSPFETRGRGVNFND